MYLGASLFVVRLSVTFGSLNIKVKGEMQSLQVCTASRCSSSRCRNFLTAHFDQKVYVQHTQKKTL